MDNIHGSHRQRGSLPCREALIVTWGHVLGGDGLLQASTESYPLSRHLYSDIRNGAGTEADTRSDKPAFLDWKDEKLQARFQCCLLVIGLCVHIGLPLFRVVFLMKLCNTAQDPFWKHPTQDRRQLTGDSSVTRRDDERMILRTSSPSPTKHRGASWPEASV